MLRRSWACQSILVRYGRFLGQLAQGSGYPHRFQPPGYEVGARGRDLHPHDVRARLRRADRRSLGIPRPCGRHTWIDQVAKIFAVLGPAAPPFLFGLLFVRLFSVSWVASNERLTAVP